MRRGAALEVEGAAVIASVLGFLRRRFRWALGEEDREDLAQEACEAVLRAQARGEAILDLVGFTRAVAWRGARDLLRDRRGAAIDPAALVFAEIEDRAGSPAQQLDRKLALLGAAAAVRRLSPEQRAAFRARFAEELSTREACERLGVPRSTYHDRLRRAMDAVRTALDAQYLELAAGNGGGEGREALR